MCFLFGVRITNTLKLELYPFHQGVSPQLRSGVTSERELLPYLIIGEMGTDLGTRSVWSESTQRLNPPAGCAPIDSPLMKTSIADLSFIITEDSFLHHMPEPVKVFKSLKR